METNVVAGYAKRLAGLGSGLERPAQTPSVTCLWCLCLCVVFLLVD